METQFNTSTRLTGRTRRHKKIKMLLALLTTILLFPFLTGSDYIKKEDIRRGADVSTYRCPNGLVSQGDRTRDVLDKCGEPMRQTRMQLDPKIIWIYRFGSQQLIYMTFANDRIQRIHSTRCWEGDPHCD